MTAVSRPRISVCPIPDNDRIRHAYILQEPLAFRNQGRVVMTYDEDDPGDNEEGNHG